MTTALILLASLSLVTMGCCAFLLLQKSRSSKTPSPTATSMPPMPLADPMVQMMQMLTRTMAEESTRNKEFLEKMILGPPQIQTSTPSTPSLDEVPTTYDYDSTPLPPGIEAVISRELEEDQQDRLQTERAVLQARLAELQAQEMSNQAHDSSPGPWSQTQDESENQN
jgi:hypothetical protein